VKTEPIVENPRRAQHQSKPLKPSATEWLTNNFGVRPSPSVMLRHLRSEFIELGLWRVVNLCFWLVCPRTRASSTLDSVSIRKYQNYAKRLWGSSQLRVRFSIRGLFFSLCGPVHGFWSSPPTAFGISNAAGDSAPLQGAMNANSSFSPFGASASTPAVLNTEGQGAATSFFSSPFGRPTAATSQVPTPAVMTPAFPASQSAPPGFPTDMSHAGVGAGATLPTVSDSASAEKHDRPPTNTLNPKAPAFSPGYQFGTTPPKSGSDGTSTAKPSSTPPVLSTSSTPTRPILPPSTRPRFPRRVPQPLHLPSCPRANLLHPSMASLSTHFCKTD
jgi:hypothetical protein